MKDTVLIEVTEREVINIGWNRHFKKNWWKLLPLPVVAFIALAFVAALIPDTWTWWLNVIASSPLLILFIWGYYRLFVIPQKAGKELWKQLREPKV